MRGADILAAYTRQFCHNFAAAYDASKEFHAAKHSNYAVTPFGRQEMRRFNRAIFSATALRHSIYAR